MQKLLFLTPELPWPANSGKRIKSWNLIKHLGKLYELHVASLLNAQNSHDINHFSRVAPVRKIKVAKVDTSRPLKNIANSLIKNQPLNVIRSESASLTQWVKDHAAEYDLIFVDHYEMMQYIPTTTPAKVVLHQHNAYYQLWKSHAKNENSLSKRLLAKTEAFRVSRYEKAVCNRADLVLAAPNDIEKLKEIGVNSGNLARTLHLAESIHLHQPDIRWTGTSKQVLYAGHLTWEPNVQGLLWYLKEVWPKILESAPDAVLQIIGGNPDQRLINAARKSRQVSFAGNQEDLEPFFKASRVFAAPLGVGSGSKMKVLTGMSRGLPTVTTPVGVEGLELGKRKAVVVTNSPVEMAHETVTLLTDKTYWREIRRASRNLVKSRYTWEVIFAEMQSELDRVLRGPGVYSRNLHGVDLVPALTQQGALS